MWFDFSGETTDGGPVPLPSTSSTTPRYRAITRGNVRQTPQWERIPRAQQEALAVVSAVLPFRTNPYVLEELIDWDRVPDDPIYQLNFLQEGMLTPPDYATMAGLLDAEAPAREVKAAADRIRLSLNPHPAGQRTHNVPQIDGRAVPGVQHKYRETVLLFPSQGQTCHAYCTFCFRWPQFVGPLEMKFQTREADDAARYLAAHSEVSDVLITGGDPLIMRTQALRAYIEPMLRPELEHITNLRLGTKSVAYWPHRFVTDPDADDLLRLFEEVVASGRHLAVMGHYNHPVELSTKVAQQAIARIRSTGAEIRMQSPLLRHINDDPAVWADLWRTGVRLGCVPYYMFIERDTGPRQYFELPMVRAWEIFGDAYRTVSGLCRTVRGPSMSAFPGKVQVDGVAEVAGEKVLALQFLQARDPSWVRRPFFAQYDAKATWLDQLKPAFGEEKFFFERELDAMPPSEHRLTVVGQ